MLDQFSRTRLLLGENSFKKLVNSRVAVFGIGGVGGFVAESLARCGVGSVDLVDNDVVSLTNVNRQVIATTMTIGQKKTTAMRQRILEINPDAKVVEHQLFFLPENADSIPFAQFDYVVDAVDTMSAKLELAVRCEQMGIPLISSMGTGNKLDPCAFKVADIYETRVCPLARIMRRELRKRGVSKLKVVYSEETPMVPSDNSSQSYPLTSDESCDEEGDCAGRRAIPGSVAFVPPVAGLIMAGEVVRDLIAFDRQS